MLTGKQFRILRTTLAVEVIEGKRTAVRVPEGSIIRVASGPTAVTPMVDVYWGSRKVEMFAVDVRSRGAEIERSEAHESAS